MHEVFVTSTFLTLACYHYWICVVCNRQLVMAISMTAADLCSMYKPWDLQLQLVHVIMEEFWIQVEYKEIIKYKLLFFILESMLSIVNNFRYQ